MYRILGLEQGCVVMLELFGNRTTLNWSNEDVGVLQRRPLDQLWKAESELLIYAPDECSFMLLATDVRTQGYC